MAATDARWIPSRRSPRSLRWIRAKCWGRQSTTAPKTAFKKRLCPIWLQWQNNKKRAWLLEDAIAEGWHQCRKGELAQVVLPPLKLQQPTVFEVWVPSMLQLPSKQNRRIHQPLFLTVSCIHFGPSKWSLPRALPIPRLKTTLPMSRFTKTSKAGAS